MKNIIVIAIIVMSTFTPLNAMFARLLSHTRNNAPSLSFRGSAHHLASMQNNRLACASKNYCTTPSTDDYVRLVEELQIAKKRLSIAEKDALEWKERYEDEKYIKKVIIGAVATITICVAAGEKLPILALLAL